MVNILKILLIIISILGCTNEHPKRYKDILSQMNESYKDNYLFDNIIYTHELYNIALSDTNSERLEEYCKNMVINDKIIIRMFYIDFPPGYSNKSIADNKELLIGVIPTMFMLDRNGDCSIYEIKYEYDITGNYVPTVKDTIIKNCDSIISILTKNNLEILNSNIKELGFPIFISIYKNNKACTVMLKSKPIYDYMDKPSSKIIDLSEKLRIIVDLSYGEWEALK